MRYTYLGDRLTRPELAKAQFNPVRDHRGKCIVSTKGTMLVQDRAGGRHVVLRRKLRVNRLQRELFPMQEIIPAEFQSLNRKPQTT